MLHRASSLTCSPSSTVAKGDLVSTTMDKLHLKYDQHSESEDHDSARESIDLTKSEANTTNGPKRKFRIIDETQLSEEEARKLELRRAYNRDCASRARTRTKSLVQELQEQVRSLKQEKEELRQSNAKLQACLAFSEKQNRELIANHSLVDRRPLPPVSLGTGDLSLLHPTSHQRLGLGHTNLGTASHWMYNAEQSRQISYLQQNLLLQQQQNVSAAAAANSSTLFPTPNSSAMNNMALSSNELNLREHLLNINSPPNSDLLEALVRMRQGYNNNAS